MRKKILKSYRIVKIIYLLFSVFYLFSLANKNIAVAQNTTYKTKQNNNKNITLPNFETVLASMSEKNKTQLLNPRLIQSLSNISKKNSSDPLLYTPDLPIFEEMKTFIKKNKPTILYEGLYYLPEIDTTQQEFLFLGISNLLRNVPVFATIQYQNLKDGNIHPLFKRSATILSNSQPIIISPPKKLQSIPHSFTQNIVYITQDMPPFGNVISKYTYSYDEYYSSFIGKNTSDIAYSGIRAVKKDNMFTSCWIIRIDGGILIYGVSSVKISGIAQLLNNVITNSFSSRMVGLFKWINEEVLHAQNTKKISIP